MKKILVIEDNVEIRENVNEILTLAGYEVLTAENGKIGVELASKHIPDLVLCDIMMPVLDGYGVLHLFNKDPKLAAVPFIFVSAKASRDDFRKGMDLGADDYITKPFNQSELLSAIESRLKKTEVLKIEYSTDAKGFGNFINDVKSVTGIELTKLDNDTQELRKKSVLYTAGSRPRFLYLIINGKVKIFKMNADGKELITGIYTSGDFVGYTALLEDSLYIDNAEVLEDAQVILIPKTDFMEIINSGNQVVRKFIQILSHNLVEKEEQLINLAYNSLRKRVATGLVQVLEKYRADSKNEISFKISRENLAQFVGTPTESLCRVLGDFRSENLVDLKDGKIEILQEEKLRNLHN